MTPKHVKHAARPGSGGGELHRPPQQNDRGIPGQPGASRGPPTVGPGLSGDDERPQEPIAPDERGD